jgi:hypothetical protein
MAPRAATAPLVFLTALVAAGGASAGRPAAPEVVALPPVVIAPIPADHPYRGGAVPPDARLAARPSRPLVAAGATLFAAGYVYSVIVGTYFAGASGAGAFGLVNSVPIAGPILYVTSTPTTPWFDRTQALLSVMVPALLFELTGVALLIPGLVARRPYVVYRRDARRAPDRAPVWHVLPGTPASPAGLSLGVVHF